MAGRIGVDTGALQLSGGQLTSLSPEVQSSLAALSAVEAAGEASAHGAIVAGAGHFAFAWQRTLTDLALAAEGLGQTVSASASSYEVTDANAIPGGEE